MNETLRIANNMTRGSEKSKRGERRALMNAEGKRS